MIVAHNLHAGGGKSVGINFLKAIRNIDSQHEYLFVIPRIDDYESITPSVGVTVEVTTSLSHRVWVDWAIIPRLVRSFKPDVILSLGNTPIRSSHIAQAVLIQDAYYVYPESEWGNTNRTLRLKKRLLRRILTARLGKIDLFFAQTNTMRNLVQSTYKGIRVELLPNVISSEVGSKSREQAPPELGDHKNLQLLVLTRYYPHKNLEIIVELFREFSEQLQNTTVYLTIEPSDHKKSARLLHEIQTLGLGKRIVNLGRLPQSDLARYYRDVDGLFLPTLMESFSSTYIEAMRFGCPILTSERQFAREICGDAAVYFDPNSTQDILSSVETLRDTPREELARAGRLQLRRFQTSWEDNARTALSALEALSVPQHPS